MSNKIKHRTPARPAPASRTSQQGVGLIEVLVAVLVLAIGLLGIAGLQSSTLRNNQSAFERSQAVTLSYLMLDAMRANASAAAAGSYDMEKRCADIDSDTLITSDQHLWIDALKTTLGKRDSTCGEIDCEANICTVRIYWDDTRGTDGVDDQMVETVSAL